jgi:Ca2+-binding RTX toxin-like protein
MRASSNPTGTAFVALLNTTTYTERINYSASINDLILNTGGGNDTVTMDDNRTYTLIQGGGGKDTFQVGQIYQSQRDANAGVAAGDVFATTLTTQGYLSNGVSFETTILGGAGNSTFDVYRNVGRLDLDGQTGNDTFVIRAFASNSAQTAVHAGSGTDTIEYVANADISIDGGTGNDTLEFIGTEFDDTFDITADGIYGLGRTVLFQGITNVIIDGDAGNDLFYVTGTAAGETLTLWGGIGSAQFIVGGQAPAVDAGGRDAHNNVIYFTPPAPSVGSGNLAAMQGTIVVNGGAPGNLPITLAKPVMLPGETNFAASSGQVISFTQGANGGPDSMTVSTSVLETVASNLGFTGATTQLLLDNLALNTISMTGGGAAGCIWQITSLTVSQTNPNQTILTLERPTQYNVATPPAAGDSYGVTNLSPSFFVNENAQINFLSVFDENSPVSDTATLTANTLTVTAGASTATIDYNNLEVMQVFLGNQGNTVNIDSTMSSSDFREVTMLNAGDGNNTVTVTLNNPSDGLLALDAGNGDNTVDASASTVGMDIFGGNGNNIIKGGSGNDIIFGGQGRVDYYNASGTLVTQLGDALDEQNLLGSNENAANSTNPYWQTDGSFSDSIVASSVAGSGGNSTNTIVEGSGNDIVMGGSGSNSITVGDGTNVVFGANGSVNIAANGALSSAATIDSSTGGDNTITVGNGTNYVFGGYGADSITAGNGTNFVFGNNGSVSFSNGAVSLAETVDSSIGSGDTIKVGNGTNYVFGGFGADSITAGNGTNFVFGDNGSITFSNGVVSLAETVDSSIGSSDTIKVGNGTNYVFGGYGSDSITAGNGTNYVFGDNGSVSFSGGAVVLAETVDSSIGSDNTIFVGTGTNYVFGGSGADQITAGYASDHVTPGNGTDFVFGDDGSVSFSNGAVVLASTVDSSIGSDNTIKVGGGTNYVFGGFGSDHITAGDGTNYVFGDNGTISFSGGVVTLASTVDSGIGSSNTITVGDGTNYVFGGFGCNTITAGNGTNVVFGHNGSVSFTNGVIVSASTLDSWIGLDPTITVGNGTNYVFGGFGSNTITAGNGANFIFGASGSISFANGKVSQMMSVDPGAGSDDTITVGNGTNYVIGGFGSNTITAGNGGNVLIGHSGEVIFNADGSRNCIYSFADNLGGNDTLRSGTGDDILIGGAGNNILYGGGGFDVMIGNGGELIYYPGDKITIESLDITLGGSNQLFAGPGPAIMIGGLGPNQFHSFNGNFADDVIIGQFAYLQLIGERLVIAETWDFADDVIASGSLFSANTGLNGQNILQAWEAEMLPEAYQRVAYAQAGGNEAAAETWSFDAAVAVDSKHGSDELPRMQQAQSSHPGSYDAPLQVPEKNAAPVEDRPIKHTDEHQDGTPAKSDGTPAKSDEGKKKNATPANSEASRQDRTLWIADPNQPRQNQALPRGLEPGAKYDDLSFAVAGLVGWGAMTSGEAKESSGLLRRDGFKRFRNKGDNDRFNSFIDRGLGDAGSAEAWLHRRSNEKPADRSPQP